MCGLDSGPSTKLNATNAQQTNRSTTTHNVRQIECIWSNVGESSIEIDRRIYNGRIENWFRATKQTRKPSLHGYFTFHIRERCAFQSNIPANVAQHFFMPSLQNTYIYVGLAEE